MVGISYADYYCPNNFVTTKEYFKKFNTRNFENNDDYEIFCEEYEKQRKIQGIYIENEIKEEEAFVKLLEKFFKEHKIAPDEIDLLIYTKGINFQNSDISVPYYMQKYFNMKNILTFNVDQTCGATANSIRISKSLMENEGINNALILSSSFLKNDLQRDVEVTLISDGAGILFLEKDNCKFDIIDFSHLTVGNYKFQISEILKVDNYNELKKYLFNGVKCINSVLEKSDVKLEDVSMIIPQNTTHLAWDYYCRMLECSKDKVYLENISKGAHMGDVDSIRNIADIIKDDKLDMNALAILFAIGWGTSWNSILLKKVN